MKTEEEKLEKIFKMVVMDCVFDREHPEFIEKEYSQLMPFIDSLKLALEKFNIEREKSKPGLAVDVNMTKPIELIEGGIGEVGELLIVDINNAISNMREVLGLNLIVTTP